jgi:hypothetical protein
MSIFLRSAKCTTNRWNQILVVLIVFMLVLTSFVFVPMTEVYAVGSAKIVAMGQCGYGLIWKLDSKGVLTISGTGKMFIPGMDDGWPADAVKNVIVKEGVTSFVSSYFAECLNLKSVSIPKSVTNMGDYDFTGTEPDSKTYRIPNAINVNKNNPKYSSEDGILFDKKKTKIIKYPAGKTRTKYTIPKSVKTISALAFRDCASLKQINIPKSLKSVQFGAFRGCSSLGSVKIPGSVILIGRGAFTDCTRLNKINIASANKNYTSVGGVVFDKSMKTLIQYPAGKSSSSYTIPKSVTKVILGAFEGNQRLSKISVAKGNKSYAGKDGVLLSKDKSKIIFYPDGKTDTSYSFPSTVSRVSESAFGEGNKLTSVTISRAFKSFVSDGEEYRYLAPFEGFTKLASISVDKVNKNFTSIDGVLFSKDGSILVKYPEGRPDKAYNAPLSIKRFEYNAFYKCTKLESVVIPNSATEFEGYFNSCPKLGSVTMPDTLKSWDNLFYACEGLKSINIPDSVTSINHAFVNCTGLTSVTVPESVDSMTGAFQGCAGLKSVNIPSSVKSLGTNNRGGHTFYGCISLETIEIPDSLESIGSSSFLGCSSLKSVNIPASVKFIAYYAFQYCPKLTAINVAADNQKYASKDGVLYDKKMTKLIQYPAGKSGTSFTFPKSVKSISRFAFEECKNLKKITLPTSMDAIGQYAFHNCTNLKMKLPSKVNEIGKFALWGVFGSNA